MAVPARAMRSRARRIVSRWSPTLYCDGMHNFDDVGVAEAIEETALGGVGQILEVALFVFQWRFAPSRYIALYSSVCGCTEPRI